MKRIYVYVSENNHSIIRKRADESGLSVSSFLAHAGLRRPIYSRKDRDLVKEVLKAVADQGRLGGLLKQWLSTGSLEGCNPSEIAQLVHDIRKAQDTILSLAADTQSRSIVKEAGEGDE